MQGNSASWLTQYKHFIPVFLLKSIAGSNVTQFLSFLLLFSLGSFNTVLVLQPQRRKFAGWRIWNYFSSFFATRNHLPPRHNPSLHSVGNQFGCWQCNWIHTERCLAKGFSCLPQPSARIMLLFLAERAWLSIRIFLIRSLISISSGTCDLQLWSQECRRHAEFKLFPKCSKELTPPHTHARCLRRQKSLKFCLFSETSEHEEFSHPPGFTAPLSSHSPWTFTAKKMLEKSVTRIPPPLCP